MRASRAAIPSGGTWTLIVTGLLSGQSGTVAVTVSKSGYVTNSAIVAGTALITPVASKPVPILDPLQQSVITGMTPSSPTPIPHATPKPLATPKPRATTTPAPSATPTPSTSPTTAAKEPEEFEIYFDLGSYQLTSTGSAALRTLAAKISGLGRAISLRV